MYGDFLNGLFSQNIKIYFAYMIKKEAMQLSHHFLFKKRKINDIPRTN